MSKRPMLPRNLNQSEGPQPFQWRELSDAVPTLAGLAALCSRHLAGLIIGDGLLGPEAEAILWLARTRGSLELQTHAESFDASDRLPAIVVDLPEQRRWMFKRHGEPRTTMAFLEGFRQLCQAGMVVHLSHREFVLTSAGFARAELVDPATIESQRTFGLELDA